VQLYYYRDPVGNFGDDLNPWLWPRLLGPRWDHAFDSDTMFIGVGSLLNDRVPVRPAKKVVFGAGCGYGTRPQTTREWRFFCVRGPLTARALDLDPQVAMSDAALLIRERVHPRGGAAIWPVSFMPHHQTQPHDEWRAVCEALDIHYVDPSGPVETTIADIRGSKLLVTEAMHGAVVADALRVPWIPVRTRPRIVSFKWEDWSRSLELVHSFEWLPPAWGPTVPEGWKRAVRPLGGRVARERLRWLVRHAVPRLSDDRVFARVYEQLRERWGLFREAALNPSSTRP
jgi:succinoglycan biosynthesis protein ExoV